jgi:hypothetical protein
MDSTHITWLEESLDKNTVQKIVLRLRTLEHQSCDESVRDRKVEDSAVLA